MAEKHQSDFEFQKEWCVTVLTFMSDEYSEEDHYQGISYKRFFQNKIDAILAGYNRNNKRGMKAAYSDINRLAKYETKNIQKLNDVLEAKFGRSLVKQSERDERKIKKIIKAGAIKTDEEYEVVKEYIDELIQKGEDEQAKILDSLLFSKKN